MTSLQQKLGELTIETHGRGFVDITTKLLRWLGEEGARDGLVTLFIQHTSASLVVQENADSDVLRDLTDALDGLAPESARYRHSAEGPDDMPAHIKAALTSVSLQIPVEDGRPQLGTWQGVYVAEHRTAPHRRRVALHFLGHCA